MRVARRSLTASILLVGLLLQPAPATAAVADGAVIVKIVHSDQTITFLVRLSLYPACVHAGPPPDPCAITPQMVQNIRSGIERIWNKGYKYKCYTIHVKVDIKVEPRALTDAADRVGVRLDRSPVPIRSQVLTQGGGNDPFSSDPAALSHPTNETSADGPSQWAFPPRRPATYAHEFGHIIGLDDTYDANGDLPGSPHDLMNSGIDGRPPTIAPSNIERLVKRQGIRDSELQCGWKLVYSSGGVTAKGTKCGKPFGTWVLDERIAAAVNQHFTLTIEIGRDLSGTWHHTFNVSAGPAGASGSDSGTAKFAYGPPPTMTASGFGTITLTTLANCRS